VIQVRRWLSATLLLALLPLVAWAAPAGTAFTYQGRLDRSGSPASGLHDLQFSLYDALTSGTQVGSTVTVAGVDVQNGLFTVTLDFGPGAFTGQARWLEISVKAQADPGYTPLTPRQPLTPAPYAMYALSAPGGGSSPWIVGADGQDLTYGNGGVGFTGRSSPFNGVGSGVFIEGGHTFGGAIFGFDYTTNTAKNVILQSPGGNVGIRTTAPDHELGVAGAGKFTYYGTTQESEGYSSALWAIGHTGGGAFGRTCNGLTAFSDDGRAVYGVSTNNWGVAGECTSAGTYTALGTPNEGLYASTASTTRPAGKFVCPSGGTSIDASWGMVKAKTLLILGGADLAERFAAPDDAEPGTVMAIDADAPGRLRVCDRAYCRTVAGVVSGANGLDAGVELGKGESRAGTVALALTGRVWVKCDATAGAIHPGDLLTTAGRAGHAMRAADHDRAQGAILGKAMTSLEAGTGLVLVLVSLQ
jgi:hypothetical protein